MTGHGVMCACTVHRAEDDLDDEYAGKAIVRAAEPDLTDTCD